MVRLNDGRTPNKALDQLAKGFARRTSLNVRALVVAGPGGWLLDLSDEAPDRPPVPAVDRDPSLGGMGLHLVAQLSTGVQSLRVDGVPVLWTPGPAPFTAGLVFGVGMEWVR